MSKNKKIDKLSTASNPLHGYHKGLYWALCCLLFTLNSGHSLSDHIYAEDTPCSLYLSIYLERSAIFGGTTEVCHECL